MSRPISSNSKKNRKRREEYGKEKTLDTLAQFEEFKATVLPQLRKLMSEGASSEKMRQELQPLLTARMLSIALTEMDSNKAITAIKDQLDRQEGKAKERTEHTHKFQNTSDQELDAIVLSKLKEAELDESEQNEH